MFACNLRLVYFCIVSASCVVDSRLAHVGLQLVAEQRSSATSVFFNVMENTCLQNATTELHEQAEAPAASQAANLRKFQVFKED